MKKRIAIADLESGMFVEADVHSERVGDAMRHFLAPRNAAYGEATNKRARLTRRKLDRVIREGGLLLADESHLAALRATGLSVVSIDTDKGIDPDPSLELDAAATDDDLAALEEGLRDVASGEEPVPVPAGETDCFLDEIAESAAGEAAAAPAYTPPEVREGRLHFGPSLRGWMQVDVDPDGRDAVLRVLCFGGDATLGVDDVMQALKDHYGLQAGFDLNLIRQLAAQAAAAPTQVLRGQYGIADANEQAKLEDLRFAFLERVSGAELSHGALQTALKLGSLEEVLAQD